MPDPLYHFIKYAQMEPWEQEIVDLKRKAREDRIRERYFLRKQGVQTYQVANIYRVQTEKLEIPEWARKHELPGSEKNPHLVWLGRGQRWTMKALTAMDLEKGGRTEVTRHDGYKCPTCGRWSLGLNARDLADRIERGRAAEVLGADVKPISCGVHCQGEK